MPAAIALLLSILGVFTLLPVATQPELPEFPDTPAGHRAQAWVEAILSGDDEALEPMILEQFAQPLLDYAPMADHLTMHREFRAEIVRVHSVTEPRENAVAMLCEGPDGWISVMLHARGEPPHKLVGIMSQEADAPEVAAAGPSADDDALGAALGEYVEALAAEGTFSGTVVVARGGRTIYAGAFGEASKRYAAPNTIDTKFNLGSANKFMTAIAINQLAEQGKLALTDTVGDLLPDYPDDDVKSRVTVHHLLTHTGGTGDHFKPEFWESSKLEYRGLHDMLGLIADNGVEFEPGSEMRYSNAGFFILGAIVEAVSGESYYDYVRNHITGPAGMTGTDCYDADMPVPNLATGYVEAEGYDDMIELDPEAADRPSWATEWRENTFLHSMKGGPAGGGYSTAPDLVRLAEAFMGGTLVSPDTRALMTTAHTPFGSSETTFYGYGTIIEDFGDGLIGFGHGGDFPGIQCRWTIIPDAEGDGYYTIAAMSNYSGVAGRVYQHAARILPRR